MPVSWDGDHFLKDVEGKLARNTTAAAQYAVARLHAYLEGHTKTGELQNSLTYSVSGGVAKVGSSSGHALFVEFGTSKMAARPFLRRLLASDGATLGAIICKD